ncbi:MAG TPA: hypothetical protein VD908_01705 [Cytophagales bacterium]|nr:hypothetical protein [Cytophagales bacterium]
MKKRNLTMYADLRDRAETVVAGRLKMTWYNNQLTPIKVNQFSNLN